MYGLSKKQQRVRPVGRCGVVAKNNNNPPHPATSLFFCLSHLSCIQMNKGATTHTLVEAITFECQKIILAVIFSNIRVTAKAMNGHGGKGNDLLLSLVTVHNSISNIFSFKSLRSLLMYFSYTSFET